ncbi:MAG TPA: DUF1223 domain-containing protein [Vicinamibacterales bacterium]|nr:DUF1223 domain-containing protein [Vicinamibacterales bacterium]
MRFPAAAVVACVCCASGVHSFAQQASARVTAASSQASATPVIVELFTSEGCEDCPPADVVLARLIADQPIAGAEVIGLGEHVDYWDQLGWKDRFSSPALTNRQQVYGAQFNIDSVYTPQMVVDGRAQFVGSDSNAARKAIERAAAVAHATVRLALASPSERSVAANVTVADLPRLARGDRAEIHVAVTEDHVTTDVKRGENRGRTLTHAAVVRSLTTIGQVAPDGHASVHAEIPLGGDWRRDQLKIVALVQEQHGRAILAAAAVSLQTARR